ncbi:hypothetical protein QA641_23330 [Bradyrhizobium sp. CB1650]|uniref:hypothetical protein n=1 Tax=Bradyrhizobium sp. CB1650 TaxID=3039153 RepID=UPI002435A406|nr:hypothetical protein [Bradyrhizobium sp. CB1650]WGD48590.1 hypothetical protein QA641_23330 [Bradyrhizobium sp. CB1650]
MKRRILIFGLLGPTLSYLLFVLLSREHAGLLVRSAWLVAPIVFVVEGGPLLICGLLDFAMERVHWWERLAIALLTGFALTFVVIFAFLPNLAKAGPAILQLGLVGAIPAAICSFLAHLAAPRPA